MNSHPYNPKLGSYSQVAKEYYDSSLHPTCANFRDLSLSFIASRLVDWPFPESSERMKLLETGAGLTCFDDPSINFKSDRFDITLQDSSAEMLQHSRDFFDNNAHFIISDARSIPVRDDEFDLVVSSLADPYNDEFFWKEVARVTCDGGYWLLTVPSHDWAKEFRSTDQAQVAEFFLANGEIIGVPSLTYDVGNLISNIGKFGPRLIKYEAKFTSMVTGPVSQKIAFTKTVPVIDCFLFKV